MESKKSTSPKTESLGEGSSLYYALSHIGDEKKEAITRVLVLTKTLAQSLEDVTEPEVAQKKIHWWHEELDRLYNGEPRHPAVAGALNAINNHGIPKSVFHTLMEANNSEKFNNAATTDDFHSRLYKDFGARVTATHRIFSQTNSADRSSPEFTVRPWAMGFGLTHSLANFRRRHNLGYPVFPDSDYSSLNVSPQDLGLATHAHKRVEFFDDKITSAITHLNEAVSSAECSPGPHGLPYYVLANLRLEQLKLWKKKNIDLFQFHVSLTPVKKVWTTIKTRRRLSSAFKTLQ